MTGLVGHHYRCAGCDYDLFQAPLGGACPECGKRIPNSKRLLKSKNPNRVNAGLRSSIRAWQRSLRLSIQFTIGLLALTIAVVVFRGPLWLAVGAGSAALVGVISILVARNEIARARDRFIPVPPSGNQRSDRT